MRSATLNIRGERSVTCRGDFDRHPVARAAAARRAAGVRIFSAISPMRWSAPPSSTRSTAAIPISKRCRCTASCSRSRIRSTPRTCARPAAATRAYDIDFPGARPHAGRAAAQQGRDHLRQGGEHRIQRPRRRSRRPQQARQGAALDARLSAQHLGRQSVQPLRHHARGLARLELGLGASRSAPTW